MSDILEYMSWRGDLTFAQSPFNEVDNLIATFISYVNLDGVVPGEGDGQITVKDASEMFFAMHSPKELAHDKSFIRRAPEVLKAAAATRRFGQAVLRNYVNEIVEEKEQQFSAVEMVFEDSTSYIAFKGTDDTIIGWKEDFNLSKGVVPAEIEAGRYLERIAGRTKGRLRLGGHSKGGNLAVYAAVTCSNAVRNRILEVYSNDGPGFTDAFLQNPNIEKVRPKIRHIVPESSIIGMLLRQVAEPIVVESAQKGILQHDGFSWIVTGPSFVHKPKLNLKAMVLKNALDKWIFNMEEEKRNAVIRDFFSVLDATGACTLTELQNGGLQNLRVMYRAIESLSPETKDSVEELIKDLVGHWSEFVI